MATVYSGALRKMRTKADTNNNVVYQLPIGEHTLDINLYRRDTLRSLRSKNKEKF